MSQHDDFLEGFADALGLTDLPRIQAHYRIWLEANSINEAERIDLETGGYQAGLEAGTWYRREYLK